MVAPFVLGLVVLWLTAAPSAHLPARPKPATRVLIKKEAHTLTVFAGDEALVTYRVAIGPGGPGYKKQEGDKITPVGRFHVIAHQPSKYRTFLRLDYPTAADRARFADLKARGELPSDATIGGDIGIHGPPLAVPGPLKSTLKEMDWTLGCIALNDDEIQELAAAVKDGTVVDIED